jgi:zinc protease
MTYSKKWLLLLSAGTFLAVSCKPSSKTTTKVETKKEVVAEVKKDTFIDPMEEVDTTAPRVKGISGLGTTNTTKVKEAAGGMEAKLPLNPAVRTGVLSNGMRYYVQQNPKPEKRIELRLAVNAGSMQEEDNQQGLAHFVEHMAFNGTTNFKKNDLVGFLENTGVRFGADLNAYTSFDETVYMLQLPTDKEGLVDKGLLVMSDWATGIAFEDTEIDKERGVIESEWRTGLGAGERMRQAYWSKLFYKSRYANRLPIGTMEVIKNAPYERFRSFYKDWYRPDLMAIIVVGDINPEEIEAKIKENFSKLQNPANPRKKESTEVPNHKETFVAIATDKEATSIEVEVIYKHTPTPTKTLDDYRTSLMHELYNSMFGERFKELSQGKDVPFFSANAGYGNFVRAKDIYYLSAVSKEKSILATLETVLVEQNRVLQHGFTESELARQKLAILKQAEKASKERDKTLSSSLAMSYVYNFLTDAPAMDAEQRLKLTKEFINSIKLEEVNALAAKWVTDENRAVIITAPQKESVKIPTQAEVLTVFDKCKDLKTEAYKDKFLDMPLLAKEPVAGKIVSSKEAAEGKVKTTELKLSNGCRVVLMPTEYKNDQILLYAYSAGGHSLYNDKDFWSASSAAGIIDESGVGAFDLIALEKKLTGTTVSLSPYIDELFEGFNGNSSVEDFETMLKLTYLYATEPRKDKDAFERNMSEQKEQLNNLSTNPMYYFYDQMVKAQSNNHARRYVLPTLADVEKVNLDRAFDIYKERFADFSDFTFVIVGNVDVEKAKPMIEKYIASLPSKNRVENYKDIGLKAPTKGVTNNLKKGIAPQSNVAITFVKDETWTREKDLQLNAMSRVLNIMVRENLREDKGGVYSPFVGGAMSKEPKGRSEVTIIFQCAPENVETLVQAVKDEIKSLQTKGTSDDNFNKVREIIRRERESNLEKNEFWRAALVQIYQRGVDLKYVGQYDEMVEKLTKDDIKKAANSFIELDKAIIITVNPEKPASEKP